jgi:cytochrome d ubiquinol oxidase subunit II
MMIHAMGPLWDGNEVWLITAGGVTFAAFPLVYAVMFSSLYSALMLILFALILRGVSFEFRNKADHPAWKKTWDIVHLSWAASCRPCCSAWPLPTFSKAFPSIRMASILGNLLTLLNPLRACWVRRVLFVCASFWCMGPCGWHHPQPTGIWPERAESVWPA